MSEKRQPTARKVAEKEVLQPKIEIDIRNDESSLPDASHSVEENYRKRKAEVKAHPVVPGSSTYRGGGRNLKRGVDFQFFRCLELLIRMPVSVSLAFWPSWTVETPIARSH